MNTHSTPHNGTSTVLSWTSVKKEYHIHTTQWNINSSKLNICQEGIPNPHHTMEHQQFQVEHPSRRNTISTPHNGISTVISWTSVKKEYHIHTTQWNINSYKLNICQVHNRFHVVQYYRWIITIVVLEFIYVFIFGFNIRRSYVMENTFQL